MKDRGEIRIGMGWQAVEGIDAPEKLIFDGPGSLYSLDLSSGGLLPLLIDPAPQGVAPICIPTNKEMIYYGTNGYQDDNGKLSSLGNGVWSYSFVSSKSVLLLEMSLVDQARSPNLMINNLWQCPADTNRFLYACVKLGIPEVDPENYGYMRTEAQGTKLYEWVRGNSVPRLLKDIEHKNATGWSNLEVDWANKAIFAIAGDRIVRLDIRSLEIQEVMKNPEKLSLTVSPRQTLLLWGGDSQEHPIEEIGPGKRRKTIALIGSMPAFSPDGSKMAFLKTSNELWLKEGDEEAQMVVDVAGPTGLMDAIRWCQCGSHIVVPLARPRSFSPDWPVLVIADTEKRRVMGRRGLRSSFEQCAWVPTSMMRGSVGA